MDAENYTREEIRKVSYFIYSSLAEAIAFETAHATSLFILNSAFASRDKSGGNIFALITACNENECSPLKQKRELCYTGNMTVVASNTINPKRFPPEVALLFLQ